jgi:hypothetical protein
MMDTMSLSRLFAGFVSLCMSLSFAYAGELTLVGVYQGKSLYVQNPFSGDNVSYCITRVTVNGTALEAKAIANSAFEIDLSALKAGAEVVVKIFHKDDCKPAVLNANVIKSSSTFKFGDLEATDKVLRWSANHDQPAGNYYIEQFTNNNWVIMKEMKPKASSQGKNTYEFPVTHHSGVNKYKIKYQERGGNSFYTNVAEYTSDKAPVTFYPKRVSDKIVFSASVEFEILDAYGLSVKKGVGTEISCADLKSGGVYYVNFDNKTEKFLKK